MIILYDKNEQAFTSLGIGVLDDAISCVVTEELNGVFELEMDYPITGVHYSDLQERKIIYAKANDILGQQPFRIYKITRPIDGTVTVYAEHISYDMSSVPIRKISANNLNELAGPNGKIQNGKVINSPFMFYIGDDKQSVNDVYYKTTKPYNMRSLLMGSDESILNIYNGEFIFDKFNVTLCDRRGSDRGFTIRYSKNMIDLEQETSSELIYDGILPYYSNTTTETKVGIGKKYVEIYIADKNVQPLTDIDGQQVFPTTWLTYKSSGLEPIKEIAKLSVVNIIATEGEYYNHLVSGKRTKLSENDETKSYFIDVTYNIAYINKSFPNEFKYGWLYKDEDITQVWQPTNGQLFRIFTPGDKLYKVYIFEGDTQTGVYREIDEKKDDVKEYGPTIPSPDTTQEEKEILLQYEGDIIYINEVRALPKEGQTQTSPTWLYKVNEVEQLINSDPRWEPVAGGDIVQTIGIPSTIIYKVPRDEEGIIAYPIDGVEVDAPGWLTLYEGSTEPLMPDGITPFVPVDQQLYNVVKPESQGGGFSKRRWFEEENKYAMAVDTRCLYTNYEWNGTEYVEHSTVNDKILTLDMSDNFKEVPSSSARFQKNLYDYTLKYIEDNKLGTLKNSIKVAFVKLSSSPEYSKWKELETVVLGDTVHVIYEELGVNEQKKVIKTEYNVLTETYDSIEIGDKGKQFVDKAVVSGDDISALTNDRNYADITTVTKLIANTIDADYIHAVTAELSNAQIDTLTAGDVTARVVTAEKFDIDNLVASLLTADDAAIRNTLVVGDNLIVNGEVNIKNGSISISGQERIDSARTAYYNEEKTVEDVDFLLSDPNDVSSVIMPELGIWYKVIDQLNLPHYYTWQLPTDEEDGKYVEQEPDENVYFEVDKSGNVTANSLTITGGSISISGSSGTSFEVTNAGYLKATGAEISGKIIATEGEIGDCKINAKGHLIVPSGYVSGTFSADVLNGGTITGCEIAIGPISGTRPTQYNFEVDEFGKVTANSLTITGGSIEIDGPSGSETSFSVTNKGYLKATGAEISGKIIADSGVIGNCQINSDGDLIIPSGHVTGTFSANVLNGGTITGCEIAIGPISGTRPTQYNFEVDKFGNVTANSLNITGGSIEIEGQSTSFSIDKNGNLEANSVTLTGGTIENLHITGSIYFRDSQAQFIEAYVRKHSITYKHSNVTMSTDWDSGEVRRHVTLYIQTSFELVGRYNGLEGLSYNDVFDPESEPYNSETDPNITKFKVLDDDGHDYTGVFINYVCDDQPRVYLHNGNYEYTDRNFGFESDDDIIAYDKQSNWLSLTDYVPGQGDGPALTPATGVIYAVYEDGVFKDFYAWNGSSYVETYGSQYYINEDGVHLPGVDATVDQTIIGPFITTSNAMTTNKDKAGILDTESGLYMDSTGVGYYNSTTRQKVAISEDYGLYSTNISIDVLRRYSGYNPSQLTNASPGTKPIFAMLTSWIMPSSDKDIITTQTPSYPNQDSFLFMTYIGSNDIPIKINGNATRTVRYGGTGELYFARNVSLVNVYVSQLTTSNNTERNVTVSWSRYNTNYWDIVIKNTAGSQIKVTLLLIFNYNYSSNN